MIFHYFHGQLSALRKIVPFPNILDYFKLPLSPVLGIRWDIDNQDISSFFGCGDHELFFTHHG
jgi:hypothetical protein